MNPIRPEHSERSFPSCVLLHCCCAPCSISCIDTLRGEGIEPHLFWYNPNIHPYTEYTLRRDCLSEFAANEKIKLSLIDEYGLRSFLNEVFPETVSELKSQLKQRCEKCYRIRLEKTASFAAHEGYGSFTTSLLISPYQNHEIIKSIGEEAAEKYGVSFYYQDFRPLFKDGQKSARDKGLYMQKYCGCIFSEEERYCKN